MAPDDYHLLDCTAAEEPLRQSLDAPDGWIYPPAFDTQAVGISFEPTENAIISDDFWRMVSFPVPQRIVPYVRYHMSVSQHHDLWTRISDALEMHGEFGSTRDKTDAEACLDQMGIPPIRRVGKRYGQIITWGKPMDLYMIVLLRMFLLARFVSSLSIMGIRSVCPLNCNKF